MAAGFTRLPLRRAAELFPSLSTQRQIDLTARVVNVMAYGARGNGLSDDTAALQLAFDDAYENGFDVYFPPSQAYYLVSDNIRVRRGMTIFGAGRSRSARSPAARSGGFRSSACGLPRPAGAATEEMPR